MKKRIAWVDNGKAICIIGVILSHIFFTPNYINTFYSPFFLTFFFFLSGYVYKKSDFKTFLRKKTLGLLLPWFCFSIITIVTSQLISFNEHSSFLDELINSFLQIRGKGDTLWFLACLYVAFFPFFFIEKIPNKCLKVIISFLLSTISIVYCIYFPKNIFSWGSNSLPWHIEIVFVACFFMILGNLFRNEFEDRFDFCFSKKPFLFSGIALIFYFGLVVINYFFVNKSNIGINSYGISISWYYFVSFVALIFAISISKLIKPNVVLSFIGCNTLIIFGLHGKVYSLIEWGLNKMSLTDILDGNIILQSFTCIIECIFVIILLILPIIVINKYFPFLLGKWYVKKDKVKSLEKENS